MRKCRQRWLQEEAIDAQERFLHSVERVPIGCDHRQAQTPESHQEGSQHDLHSNTRRVYGRD